MIDRLLVVYVRGVDRRDLNADVSPFLHDMLHNQPTVTLQSLPFTDQLPTLLTGLAPAEHGVMGVTLREPDDNLSTKVLDLVPDRLTTFGQCCLHALRGGVDLASVPWRRRRHFDLHRLGDKTTRHERGMDMVGGHHTLLGELQDTSAYRFTPHLADLDRYVETLGSDELQLELLDTYAYDLYEHWHIDQPDLMRDCRRKIDAFCAKVAEKCAANGVTLAVMSDHGQHAVDRSIDLHRLLRRAGFSTDEYHVFIEVPVARFWFKNNRIRKQIEQLLSAKSNLHLVPWQDMHEHGVALENGDFGDLWVYTEGGCVFYPSDFHHPVGSWYLGHKNPEMKPRQTHGRHRGYHGHLPITDPAELGFFTVLDHRVEMNAEMMRVIDFAPTVMSLLGEAIPQRMKGRVVAGPVEKAAAA